MKALRSHLRRSGVLEIWTWLGRACVTRSHTPAPQDHKNIESSNMKSIAVCSLIVILLGWCGVVEATHGRSQEAARKALAQAQAKPRTTLRTEAISGTTPGVYMSLSEYEDVQCVGHPVDITIYKTNICIPIFDENGIVELRVKTNCFLDSGESAIMWYAPSDTGCTGSPMFGIEGPTSRCDDTRMPKCFSDLNILKTIHKDKFAAL